MMETKRLEQLKKILYKNYGSEFSDAQAFEIGKSLIEYFDILQKNKWKLGKNEKREKL